MWFLEVLLSLITDRYSYIWIFGKNIEYFTYLIDQLSWMSNNNHLVVIYTWVNSHHCWHCKSTSFPATVHCLKEEIFFSIVLHDIGYWLSLNNGGLSIQERWFLKILNKPIWKVKSLPSLLFWLKIFDNVLALDCKHSLDCITLVFFIFFLLLLWLRFRSLCWNTIISL